jgi:hypothetical protein
MKAALLVAALVVVAVAPGRAQQPGPHEAELRTFYASFLAAMRANDRQKLVDLIAFPVQDWSVERKGDVQTGSVKDRADFLARYATLVTPFMRTHVARAKLQALPTGTYVLVWHDAGAEFSFEFDYIDGTGYRVRSYTIGPE